MGVQGSVCPTAELLHPQPSVWGFALKKKQPECYSVGAHDFRHTKDLSTCRVTAYTSPNSQIYRA